MDQFFRIRHLLDKENWWYNRTIPQLFVDFEKTYGSVRTEVLYNIQIEFGIPMKLICLIKMCLNRAHNKVRIGENLS
jgi:hypothetical protein